MNRLPCAYPCFAMGSERPARTYASTSASTSARTSARTHLSSSSPVLVDASAIGTTVLQLKEIPMRPAEFDGALCLFDLSKGCTEEASVRAALSGFGTIVSCELGALGPATAIVRFSTHAAAVSVKRAAAELKHLCGAADTLYNERSYDGRGEDEEGFEGMQDEGRGW